MNLSKIRFLFRLENVLIIVDGERVRIFSKTGNMTTTARSLIAMFTNATEMKQKSGGAAGFRSLHLHFTSVSLPDFGDRGGLPGLSQRPLRRVGKISPARPESPSVPSCSPSSPLGAVRNSSEELGNTIRHGPDKLHRRQVRRKRRWRSRRDTCR